MRSLQLCAHVSPLTVWNTLRSLCKLANIFVRFQPIVGFLNRFSYNSLYQMSQKSVAAVLIQAARRTDRHDEAHRRFSRLCECASSDALSRVLRGMILRVYDTRVVQTSNTLIARKPQEETAKPMKEAVRCSPVLPDDMKPLAQRQSRMEMVCLTKKKLPKWW